MYWDREKVLWERPKLLGCQQIGSTQVDFASQFGVYMLHDRREVLYVGRTTDQSFGTRIKEHTINRLNGRWDRFSWFGVYPVREDGSLDTSAQPNYSLTNLITTMEALLIEGLEPRQNRKRGDGFQAIEYLQVEDPEIRKRHEHATIITAMQKALQS